MTYLALPSMETMDMTLSPPKEPVLVAQPPLLLPRHSKIQELVPRQSKVQEQFRYSRVQRSLPVVLLPDDDMAALYEEQVRMASPLARVSRDRGSSVITEPLVPRGLGKIILHSERPQERRVSNVSRPRTSSSTSRRSTPQFECHICFEKLDAEQTQLCETCEGSYCKNCMKWYIEYKIREGEVSKKKMVCPAPQCPHPLSEELVKSFVSPELQEKYYQYLNNQRPGVRFCPQPGCCALIEEPLNSTKRRVHCTACGHDSCMRCKGDYHKLRTCRRVDRRYGKWKKNNNVRACPNCHTDIEKQGGCCHMKCFQCDQEFCWSCLRSWQNHDETLCVPLAFLRSKSSKYGPWQPVRVLTKSVIVGAAAVVVVTGAGVAVVVVPSVLLFQWAKTSWRTRRYLMRDTEAFMIE